MLEKLKAWAKRLKRDGVMLWFARCHPRTPWLPKVLSIATAAYVLSPVDLIPDFIPILGYLDEVILVPLLIALIVRLLPEEVVRECRRQAEAWLAENGRKPVSYAGAALIAAIWLLAGWLIWRALADN